MKEDKLLYYTLEIDEYFVRIFISKEDIKTQRILNEKRQKGKIDLGGPHSARKDPACIPISKKHLHILKGMNQIFAINYDGTGHDGSTGYKISNKLADKMRDTFPDIRIPDNNVIESINICDIDEKDERIVLLKDLLNYLIK